MTIVSIAQKVVDEKQAHLLRIRSGKTRLVETRVVNLEYDCKPIFTGNHRGWVILDLYTASAITAVYNALNEQNKAKFGTLSLKAIVDFCYTAVA